MLTAQFSIYAFSIRLYRYTCVNLIPGFPLISWFLFMFLVSACTCMLESHLIMYIFVCLYMSLGTRLTTRWVTSDNSGPAYSDFGAWSMRVLPFADQRCAVEAWIISRPSEALSFQPPCPTLEFSLCDSWAPFVLYILVYLFIFSQSRPSVMWYSCNIVPL